MGGDASQYAASVYGAPGQQHPVADSNVIAMKNADMPMPAQRGGGNEEFALEQEDIKGGESTLVDLAIPAAFLIANQAMIKRARKSGKKSRKLSRGRRSSSRRRR